MFLLRLAGEANGVGPGGWGVGGEEGGCGAFGYLASPAKPALTKKEVLTVYCLIGDNHTFCIHPSLIARQKIKHHVICNGHL